MQMKFTRKPAQEKKAAAVFIFFVYVIAGGAAIGLAADAGLIKSSTASVLAGVFQGVMVGCVWILVKWPESVLAPWVRVGTAIKRMADALASATRRP